ncbi:MAG: hypothetical protein ABUJ92_00280 [Desulfobacterales bacterium]
MKTEINGTDLTITADTIEESAELERWSDLRVRGEGRIFTKTIFADNVIDDIARDNEGLSEG